nr:phage tail protein [Psychrobacter sp. PraFG1]UNK04714.1 phage tail protein [Psychrobacter sp. PraFG1]
MRKFDWRFDMGASAQTVNKVNKVQMGDGYVQRPKAKINNKLLCTRQKNYPHPIFIGLGVKS